MWCMVVCWCGDGGRDCDVVVWRCGDEGGAVSSGVVT
jgi:hypothetical protein